MTFRFCSNGILAGLVDTIYKTDVALVVVVNSVYEVLARPPSFLQHLLPPLRTLPPVMVGILQRTVSLRAALRHLSPQSAFSSAATLRYSSVSPCSRFLPSTSGQLVVGRRRLNTGADGPKPSPDAAPGRMAFSKITEEDLAFFRKILPGRAVTDPDLLESNNVDWLKTVRGDGGSWNDAQSKNNLLWS